MEEDEIIKLAKAKDEKAFEQLVNQYKPIVEKFAFQFGMEPEIIPDIVQETFIKIYRKIHQYHRGKFSTWIYQITLNVTRDYYRKRKREFNLIDKAKKTQIMEIQGGYYFEKEEHLFLHECIQKLDPKYKTPIILYYFHDKTYEEIAMILKIKLSSVKTRIHRGKMKLKEIYEQAEGKEVYMNG
ncbi:hypothetical protein CIL05_15880 [Virgibacillus profundi]|uniref:RNA polymerase sigma factor n=1 Tax=Virgibacillus profundi TaxID=2024555 RepID=A0A2A2IAV3_9BACI|nr:RNA polymerase sigma factor [Virgibacillus profundi]PAV28757.1 hypothetical protein CIL05_15880 [Virgibacillus profundi]PXY52925.1 RNA polymerase sigma factor [Virgibacillus profundi]